MARRRPTVLVPRLVLAAAARAERAVRALRRSEGEPRIRSTADRGVSRRPAGRSPPARHPRALFVRLDEEELRAHRGFRRPVHRRRTVVLLQGHQRPLARRADSGRARAVRRALPPDDAAGSQGVARPRMTIAPCRSYCEIRRSRIISTMTDRKLATTIASINPATPRPLRSPSHHASGGITTT